MILSDAACCCCFPAAVAQSHLPLVLTAHLVTDDRLAPESWAKHFPAHFDDCMPGERPDTLLIDGLPKRWLTSSSGAKPSDEEVAEAARFFFSSLGNVRDVCLAAPPDDEGATAGFNLTIAVHVQYETFEGFCRACASLRNRKLVGPTIAAMCALSLRLR